MDLTFSVVSHMPIVSSAYPVRPMTVFKWFRTTPLYLIFRLSVCDRSDWLSPSFHSIVRSRVPSYKLYIPSPLYILAWPLFLCRLARHLLSRFPATRRHIHFGLYPMASWYQCNRCTSDVSASLGRCLYSSADLARWLARFGLCQRTHLKLSLTHGTVALRVWRRRKKSVWINRYP